MFIRREKKKRGSDEVIYVALAHNVREPDVKKGGTRPKPVVLARLGREKDLDANMVKGARDAFDRYLRRRFGDAAVDEGQLDAAADTLREQAPALKVLCSKSFGMRVVVEAVWKHLGFDAALREVGGSVASTFPFERIVFAMVLNRLVDPTSKRACNEWVRNEAWFPELDPDQLGVQHFYRALDLLDRHVDQVMAAVGAAARATCTPEDLELLLIDTTSTYVESDFDDVERKEIEEEWARHLRGEGPRPTAPIPQVVNDPPLRMRGHSKDNHPREPQVKVGLVTTRRGQVVDVQTVAGNVNDQRLTTELVEAARTRLPGLRVAAVMDSGMGGTPNLRALDAMTPPIDRVSGVPLRQSKVAEERLLARAGRWRAHPYKEGFTTRAVRLEGEDAPLGRAELWVATRNEVEARRQRRVLDKKLEELKAALAMQDGTQDACASSCALTSKTAWKRYLRKSQDGRRLVLDQERIRIERRRAGVKVLRSTLVDQPVRATLEAYDAQYGIEAQFRTYKGPLKLRPMHHRAQRRIKAHIVMCTLALMVVRELERRTELSLTEIQRRVGRVRAMEMQSGSSVFWQREEWSEEAVALLTAVGADEGARTWGARSLAST